MVCSLNLTQREAPKQLNPINMIFPLLLHQIIKHIGARVRLSYYQHMDDARLYAALIMGELHFLGSGLFLQY